MRKTITLAFCLILMLSLSLAACDLPFGGSSDFDENTAQTLVALAFTQTAIAQEMAVETEAPPAGEETEAAAETVEVTHTLTPGEPGWIYKWFYDTDASKNAAGKYITGGDDFTANLYERPFTETEMDYRPDIDINKTEISSDDNFYYVTIYLNDQNPDGGLQGIYGVEIDADRDGRGDLLVIADHPTATGWDIAGVSAHSDSNNDVGGASIMRPDSGYSGDGFDEVLFSMDVLDDPDAAWSRINLGTPPSVTLAFKKSLIAGYSTFVWGVWAADSLLDPAMIDLHDHFTDTEAGSPYQAHANYPLAALNLVDNTCRETYGFDATDPIPGLCVQPEEPQPTSQPGTTPEEPTPEPQPGTISVIVFWDSYPYNHMYDASDSLYDGSATVVTLHAGSCSSSSIQTSSSKNFSFSNLPAGNYCVKITPLCDSTPSETGTFTLGEGATVRVEFGYQAPY